MKPPAHRYDAFWVPGLDNDDIDRDDSLRVAFRWLDQAERDHGGKGVIVMYAKKMMNNAPLLSRAAGRWEFFSTRSRGHYRDGGPVLTIYPNDETLELAEHKAFGSALCVVPGSLFDVSPWIRRTNAQCLIEGFDVQPGEAVPEDIAKELDHVLFFGGHNNFLGGGEKEVTIRALKDIARRPDAPSREAIEAHMRQSGETAASGVQRAGKWYDEIRAGKRHRDYRGQII